MARNDIIRLRRIQPNAPITVLLFSKVMKPIGQAICIINCFTKLALGHQLKNGCEWQLLSA